MVRQITAGSGGFKRESAGCGLGWRRGEGKTRSACNLQRLRLLFRESDIGCTAQGTDLARRKMSEISTLSEFLDVFSALQQKRPGELLVFRGHKNRSFEALPSTFRTDGWIGNEAKMLRSLLAVQPEEFDRDRTTFEKLVRAQHYGLPVTSRKVVWLLLEQLRLDFVPVLHRLQGRPAAQG